MKGAEVQSWLYERLGIGSINFFPPAFCSAIFCGTQIQRNVPARTRISLWKLASTARSTRECIAFYVELEWHKPESSICFLGFIYKPFQRKEHKEWCLFWPNAESTPIFLHTRNRLEIKVHCGNADRPWTSELQKGCSFVSGLVENISCFLS